MGSGPAGERAPTRGPRASTGPSGRGGCGPRADSRDGQRGAGLGDPGVPVPAAGGGRAFAGRVRGTAACTRRWGRLGPRRRRSRLGARCRTRGRRGGSGAVADGSGSPLAPRGRQRHHGAIRRPKGEHTRSLRSWTTAWWALALGRDPTAECSSRIRQRAARPPLAAGTHPAWAHRAAGHPRTDRVRAVPAGRDPGRRRRRPPAPVAARSSPRALRGVGTGSTAAAAAWGREQGARWAVLQVALHNTAARALYDALGATEHHRYRYLVPPSLEHRWDGRKRPSRRQATCRRNATCRSGRRAGGRVVGRAANSWRENSGRSRRRG